jgi:D-xylose transport system substrate-binding protein
MLALSVGVALSSVSASAKTRLVSGHAASINANSFTNTFSALKALKGIAAAGHGKIAAILPDTTSSTRYVEFDQPDIKKAAAAAGLPSSDVIVQNANGSDSTFYSDAQADITNGATVLLIDPEDSGTGVKVENYAKQHGVDVIDYDRLDLGGPSDPYVSFNNVNVGKLIGKGFVSCVSAWHVSHPNVIMMYGSPTDNNATLFAQGYDGVLAPYFKSGKYTLLQKTAGTWNPTSPSPDALAEFSAAYTAHPTANSAVIPNDENGAPIITYLKSHGVKPETFPTTGQDATLTGLQNIISGYQCGTVYKAVYKEAGAAVALALYLRDGKKAPSGLLNGSVQDTQTHKSVRSVLLPPVWVTPKNMKATIIKDNFVTAKQLCTTAYKADCKKYGI